MPTKLKEMKVHISEQMDDAIKRAQDDIRLKPKKNDTPKDKPTKLSANAALLSLAAKGYEALYGEILEDVIPGRGGYRLKPEDQAKLDEYDKLKQSADSE